MCARCKLAELTALVNGTSEPRAKTKSASLVPKIKWVKREPTKVQKVERQVKLEELVKW
ncbi:MAG TPA: hypothetical protein VFS97_04500 [Nitrososphaeraceae archaeon]|nr:hypothetical protein [Nitrososphaeraceae archaeon]